MKRFKRSILIVLAGAVVSGMASGAFLVVQTQNQYYGACSKLSGFPGFLQQSGMLVTGSCKSLPGGAFCSAGSACTVNSQAGTCKNTAVSGAPICACVANVSAPH